MSRKKFAYDSSEVGFTWMIKNKMVVEQREL